MVPPRALSNSPKLPHNKNYKTGTVKNRCTDRDLADKINEAFVGVMQEYNPLSDDALVLCEDDESISVTVDSVAARLSKISSSGATCQTGC